jgi:hypothetical protein
MSFSLIHYGTEQSVVLNGRSYSFCDFLKVCGDYSVPHGFTTRVYTKGVQHYITDGSNTLYLPKDDKSCDQWCSQEPQLALLVQRLKMEKGE